jgi:hypothetical protein
VGVVSLRSVFLGNLPVGVVAVVTAAKLVSESV